MEPWLDTVRARLAEAGGQPPDRDVVEELAAHLEQVCEMARRDGASEDEARTMALSVLADPARLRQTLAARRPPVTRRVQAWARQEPAARTGERGIMARMDLSRDARHALRLLLRTPVFSAIAVLTFALGIGVNTAVFTVINGVLLRPLPYPHSDRITMVWLDNRRQNIREDITSYPNYRDWRNQNTIYEHLAAFNTPAFNLTGAGEPERLRGATVTANFFDVMGVPPLVGRVFTGEHEIEGRDGVVVLSYGLWERRFGSAPDVLGRTITLNGRPHEVIGVMPRELRMPDRAEFWKPLAPPQDAREARTAFWLPVIGRLKPGVTVEQAQAEMSGISSRLEQTYENLRGFGAYVVPLHQQMVGSIERPLLVLMGAVAFVLLIACTNLANLMLGRMTARRKELAIRAALGAGRGRIIRQIVTEALVLAILGGAVGVLLAYWATGFFIALGGESIPRVESIAIDRRVLAFALGLATLAALLSGLIPALHASRTAAADHLREGGRQAGGTVSRRTRSVLVAAEVALALVLLTGAGLLIRTLWGMQQVSRGFTAERIAIATVSAPAVSYAGPPEVRAFYARLLERVRALPGVESGATASEILQGLLANSTVFTVEGQPLPPPEERVEYPFLAVSPGFFETLQIPFLRGRGFTEQDHPDAPRAVVVNETLARTVWPDQDPIGRRLRAGGDQAPWFTVVGVIRDVYRADVTRAIRPEVYLCALQSTPRTQTLVLRTAGDPTAIIPAVRRELQAIDPELPLFGAGTLADELADTLNQPRFQATLLGGFAAIALLLAAIGIYGVTAHAVSQRTQEVGIRMALGAHGGDVLGLIIRQHLTPALAGVTIGLAIALFLSRFLDSLLFGVRAGDPLTFASTALALLAVALLACWIPARRATKVDPLSALRAE